MQLKEKWEMSSWHSNYRYFPSEVSENKEWLASQTRIQEQHIKYWKKINPKNKKQLIQFITRSCPFYTFNYIVEPFSTKELRCAYEMYMDQKSIPSKTRLGFFILGQFNCISEIIKEAKFPKDIKTFKDLTKTKFGPELYIALSAFAQKIDQYQKYNNNWHDYIPLEIALQKRSSIPINIETYSYQSWNYKEQKDELKVSRSFCEQEQPWKFIGLITRKTKHVRDTRWTKSPWYKEIQLEQKLLGR